MALTEKDISKQLSFKRVLIPILIGLGVIIWLLVNNFTTETMVLANAQTGTHVWNAELDNGNAAPDLSNTAEFSETAVNSAPPSTLYYTKTTNWDALTQVNWTWRTTFWLFVALLMVVARDLGYMYRIRVLTENRINWRNSFDVIMLWEFGSAITPSVVGGSGLAVFLLNREGISMGRSTATVLVTALLDELFYLIMVPIVLLVVGTANLFIIDKEATLLGIHLNTEGIFWVGLGFIFLLTSFILFAIFIKPHAFKKGLMFVFRLRFLARWRAIAEKTGDDMIIASRELKGKSFGFWLKAFGATFFSWTARFWIVNCLILAFVSHDFYDNMLIYARQLVMWVIMLISPTPGGTGVAELAFSGFLAEFIPLTALVIPIAILWRLMSYYPYLLVGLIVFPTWIRRTGKKAKPNEA